MCPVCFTGADTVTRETLNAEFRTALAEFGARVCSVRGTGESRMAAALNCIAKQG